MTKRERSEAAKVTSLFYGTLLQRKVERGGRVPGLNRFMSQLTEAQVYQCQRYVAAVCAKINRGRNRAECIAAGVKALKLELGMIKGPPLTSGQITLLEEFGWEPIEIEKPPSIDG